ncbi:Lipid-binding SYLF domain-containing protein [Amphritea atlantica]|uniref:Lipid-binding SYLF domain-containing protein n=1 Tax=Amphritea atlantica TaxID=355243 RepID=A0A1H9DGY9_9GAMM|nr:YSC84-related protein [Amphritea atlantica]SEQ12008.1 Lipid-binding SYLF domain-containing protein [Amphritea atlantica]
MKFLTVLLVSSLLACLPVSANAASAQEIDAKVNQTLKEFYHHSPAGKELARKAVGVLVFPDVIKAGMGIGGEYGEGALRVGGKTAAYYNVASASIGFQLGAQIKSEVLLFMSQEALDKFRNSDGWEAGVDGSVALATVGAGGQIDSNTVQQPIIGFIFSNKGLMYNLSIEGSKITRIDR